jgi:undecaprenyl-diphosphatase
MGFAQALSIIPGVSRSGSTITAGLFLGLDRVSATRFSFLLGIPITAGAIIKVFTGNGIMQEVRSEQTVLLVGVLTALASGLFAIRFMLKFLASHSLNIFAYYRVALGIILLVSFTLR